MNLSKGMNKVTTSAVKVIFSGFSAFLLLISTATLAEDIELYISDTIKQTQSRPKVLIVFDTSGSMGWTDKFKPAYNPAIDYGDVYGALPGLTLSSKNYIYYSKGDTSDITPIPDSTVEKRKFIDDINGCNEARLILDLYGTYTGRIREYTFQGNSGRWTEISEITGEDIKLLDCEEDVVKSNNLNGKILNGTVAVSLPAPQNGYPIDGQGTLAAPQYYTPLVVNSNVSWSGQYVTLYTDNYLRWQQNDNITKIDRTRMEVAKESVSNLIKTSPNVDFGLQVFNYNGSDTYSGGRIVHGIQDTDIAAKDLLLKMIKDEVTAYGATPLCETLFEASRYFGGKALFYGNRGSTLVPYKDPNVEKTGGIYKSPFASCSDRVYVVLITDGVPTSDSDANSEIPKIPVAGQDPITTADNFHYRTDHDSNKYYSYLPALAGWLNKNDINTSIDGKQTAEIYTVGFSPGAQDAKLLLDETATRGGGKSFQANDSAELTTALSNVLANLQPSNDTLTSASVASNNFDQTQTLDSVYYAMFQPDRGPRWQGNIKKYKVVDGAQEGSNHKKAINQVTGHFSDDVQSYWSSSVDGDKVKEGGVAEMLSKKTNRVIYSDLGDNHALVKLNYSDASSSEIYKTPAKLAEGLDVTNDEAVITDMLDWIVGIDVDDENDDGKVDDIRLDVFGDPLHSKPVVLNFGGGNIYILVGTNHGVIHMFADDDTANSVDETWAFMPNDFISNIKPLRENYTSADKIYGADGVITSHIVDINGDGVVDSSDGDKVWVFFGFRRGGNKYYAMNVTDPLNPFVMWTIEGGDVGFEELGQTWSQPILTYSKLNASGTVAKPVLVFGGGYATSKDSKGVGGATGPDNLGKAIYMVDAETGTLKWSLSPTGDTPFSGTDSIASSIGVLDSDGDGLTDRLYAGDTGGNVWRVDMPGSDTDKFSVFKLASFGNTETPAKLINDRRFFSEPAIVRAFITETIDSGKIDKDGKPIIVQQEIPYDAILLGSGDITNPIGTDTKDKSFMIKDINIKTQQFLETATSTISAFPDEIVITNLADYTGNPFDQDLTTQERETLSLAVSQLNGWFMDLEQPGEKSTAAALVINNVVNFTSYTPPTLGVNSLSCDLPNGKGWAYAVDLALGTHIYDWEAQDANNRSDRIAFISEQFLGSPTLIVTEKLNPDTGLLEADGNIIVGRKIMPVGFQLQTLRTYLYVTEN